MNYFDNIPNFNIPIQGMNNPMMNNNINHKILELENRIKRLELKVSQLESDKGNNNYTEPDTSLYMI